MAVRESKLVVFREIFGSFQEVGFITAIDRALFFEYSPDYLGDRDAQPISHVLPLKSGCFEHAVTSSFFEGILPEGSMRRALSASFHASGGDLHALLSRLNNESAGALVFKVPGEEPEEGRGYEPIGDDGLQRFARSPREFAPQAAVRSRLSLAGAQMKVGLYLDASMGKWCLPLGSAPSSHIVKACDGAFPLQTINEAICMATAKALGFEVAQCRLLDIGDGEPLLAVERFDRIDAGGEFLHRIHQEDFHQAFSEFGDKYEPTDGNYANHCAWLIGEESSNPFGDRMMLFSRLLVDWALGNADNHLKNHSMLWSEDWSSRMLSPLYDLTCTTVYPEIDREMGVSFGGSRRIDCVVRADVLRTARACGVGEKRGGMELDSLLEDFPSALDCAISGIAAEGFPEAENIGEKIMEGFLARRDVMG